MIKKFNLFALFILNLMSFGQSIDFGVEVQQNTNLVKKWLLTDELSEYNRAFSILDNNADTVNVYFNSFSMSNNFEIPFYFRYNFKKRSFIDIKLSNTVHTLNMEGVSNYNNSFFISNYGTYDDFVAQAQLDGFTDVSQSDYDNYIAGAKAQFQNTVRSKEEFKVLSLTTNYGIRFLPHRSIKPYLTLGFTFKGKYRKYSYQHLDFESNTIYDFNKINEGVNKFAEKTAYLNFGFGLEFYRFRVGLYYQGGFAFQLSSAKTNQLVVDVNPYTPFERIHSYGFSITTNLFSAPLRKKIVTDDISTNDDVIFSNIQRKIYKWEFGVRLNRRGFNDLNTYYANPDNRLSLLTRDSILYNNNGTIVSAEKIEMITLGDIKRIVWSGQLDLFAKRNFGRRFSVEMSMGFSNLINDIETTELSATVLHNDSLPQSYIYSAAEPRLKSGVYRNTFSLTNFTTTLAYKFVDRDLFDLSFIFGSGFTIMSHRSLAYTDLPDGVNELAIYKTIDDNYYNLADNNLYVYQGPMEVNLNDSPNAVFDKFNNTKLDETWKTPKPQRFTFPTMRLGFEASVDRFKLGLAVEKSTTYMDGLLLNSYSSIYFSMAYTLIRR